jgi:hypothetical protein
MERIWIVQVLDDIVRFANKQGDVGIASIVLTAREQVESELKQTAAKGQSNVISFKRRSV